MREIYRGLFAPVALIGLIHIIGGTAVLFARQAAYVSQLSGPMMLLPEPIAIAIGLIVVGVMAIAARLLKMSEQMRVALIAPQQILLTIQFIASALPHGTALIPMGTFLFLAIGRLLFGSFLGIRRHCWCFACLTPSNSSR